MAEQIKAKMKVNLVVKHGYENNTPSADGSTYVQTGESVDLTAVYSADPNTENYSYSSATPNAHLTMTISNPQAFDFFEEGAEYVLTFEKAG